MFSGPKYSYHQTWSSTWSPQVMVWVLQKWKSLWIDICRPTSRIAWDPRSQYLPEIENDARFAPRNFQSFHDVSSSIWLVVWLPFFMFPYIGNNHPNWRSYFSEGWPNHQPAIVVQFLSTCSTCSTCSVRWFPSLSHIPTRFAEVRAFTRPHLREADGMQPDWKLWSF